MEELNYQAIVLIYPDGFVEKLPITNLKFHWEYLKEHTKYSKRFSSLCGDLLNDINHFSLDKMLAANGICVLYNWNIREIVEEKTLDHIHFLYYLPSAFQSLKQLLEFLILIRLIDFKYVWLKLFDEQNLELSFKNLNEGKFKEFILANKKKLLEKVVLFLLYPDGEMEEITRNNFRSHMEHFKEHTKNSIRFQSIIGEEIKNNYRHNHYKVMNCLTNEGIVEIANRAKDLTQAYLNEANHSLELNFQISLPKNMGSIKQTEILEILLKDFPKETFEFIKSPLDHFSFEAYQYFMTENKFLFTNDNIRSQAIILIYPDGEVERILIDTETLLTEYLKRHFKNSRRFSKIVEGQNLNFDWGIHFHIDKVLLSSGVIVLYNDNVKDIVNDSSYVYNYPVFFDTYLCSEFFSKRQEDEFKCIYNENKELMTFHIFDRTQNKYLEEIESFKL